MRKHSIDIIDETLRPLLSKITKLKAELADLESRKNRLIRNRFKLNLGDPKPCSKGKVIKG